MINERVQGCIADTLTNKNLDDIFLTVYTSIADALTNCQMRGIQATGIVCVCRIQKTGIWVFVISKFKPTNFS